MQCIVRSIDESKPHYNMQNRGLYVCMYVCMYEITYVWLEDLCNDVLGVHVATDRVPGLDETGRLLLLLQLPSDVFVAVQTVQ